MKITATETYTYHDGCPFDECARNYCSTHRLLWRDCETMKEGIEGDSDVINGTRTIYEVGDCPKCEHEAERRRFERLVASQKNAA